MHGLAVFVKIGPPFARDLSLENSADSYLCYLYFTQCLASFSSIDPLFSALCMVLDSISYNIDDTVLINSSANVSVFGDYNVHHKDWLTYSGGTD